MSLARNGFLLLALGISLPAMAEENIDCADPKTQSDMTICAGLDWEAADKDLNAIYKLAIASAKDFDVGLKDANAAELVGAEEALRDAQRAWVVYRDKACDAYGFTARGGSMEPMLVYSCRAEMTRQRIKDLHELTDVFGPS